MIGKTISHYRILEKLGEGGMGVVYKAQDAKLDRIVALKFLPKHFLCDDEAKTRFVHEAKAASALNHPNISTIHEIDEAEGECFMCMEYVEGKSLKELIKGGQIQDWEIGKAVDVAIQIAEGLSKAHQKGIVHRDVKSDNIMLTPEGLVKIMDFGLAKLKGVTGLTKTGTTLGTMQYMSPEQAQGIEADHRSDIFSFGVVLYEMITGQLPFKGEHEAAIIYSIVNETPEPLARYKANVLVELERIVEKALKKDPSTRYQSAADMIADLKGLQKETTTAALVAPQKKRIRNRSIALIGTAVLIVVAGYAVLSRFLGPSEERSIPEKKMLVVLPFENLGSAEHEYFADGITDEITARLASIGGLGVIARTSAVQYKKTDKTIQQIGEELGVGYVLEGTIRWQRISGRQSQIRVTPQLIRVSDATHLWAEVYQKDITDIFKVQSDIAEKVVEALDVTLVEPERRALTEKPTESTEAYDSYLQGNHYFDDTEKGMRNAESMYLRAIELEPGFALAHLRLARVHVQMYWYYYDRTEQRLSAAKEAIEKAFESSPDLPEAHMELGWYYYHGHLDYDRALQEFTLARQNLPNDRRLLSSIAQVQRRQGKWDEAIANFRQALKLNPRSAGAIYLLAGTLITVREYREAERLLHRVHELKPDLRWAYIQRWFLYLLWKGDTKEARSVLQEALARTGRSPMLTYLEVSLDMIDGEYEHALNLLSGPGQAYAIATTDTAEYHNLKGDMYRHIGSDLNEAHYDSARVFLERMATADPEDPYVHLFLGRAYANLGRKADAIREGQLAVELYPVSKDAFTATDLVAVLAEIYTIVGEYDLAIDQLEYLLSIPAWVSVPYVKIWPDFAPLRNHPRFQKLLEKYSQDKQ
jgi:serine/threonine protein kinase/Flp pilus assembly protein TadD